jgi:Bacteriodetes cell division protein (FtsL-like)
MIPKAPITKQNKPLETPTVEERPRVQQQPKKETPPKKLGRFSPWRVLRGEFLADAKAIKYVPFVLFLTALAMVYIANAYYVERKVVKIQKLNKRVKDLHTNYVSVKADLMFSMKQTEIATKMAESGLKESVTPPNVIRINEKETKIY